MKVLQESSPFWNYNLYSSNAKVFLPASYAYSDLCFSDALDSSHKYLNEVEKLLKELITQHADIHLKLHPEITDIRPFLWNNFLAKQRYTYFVKLNKVDKEVFENNAEYKRWQHLNLIELPLNTCDINAQLDFLKSKVSEARLSIIRQDLLRNLDQLYTLNVVDEQKNVLAQMIFVYNNNAVQQLFYSDDKSFKRNRGGVFAQYAFMLYFKNKNIAQFDFCGANFKSIAKYKSRFPVELMPYFELWYHRNVFKRIARKFLLHQI